MYVKASLTIALAVALVGVVTLLTRVQELERRGLLAEQSQQIAESDAADIEAWATTLSDSLGRTLALLDPPDGLDLSEDVESSLVARNAQASAAFWYEEARRAKGNQNMLLEEHEVAALHARGLRDPVIELREDLLRRPDLIPFEGTMGGRMQFVPTGIAVLSPEWIYARFEDGHVGGSCLLAFDVLPSGEISWRRLAARQD
jgi:hypothetical protein